MSLPVHKVAGVKKPKSTCELLQGWVVAVKSLQDIASVTHSGSWSVLLSKMTESLRYLDTNKRLSTLLPLRVNVLPICKISVIGRNNPPNLSLNGPLSPKVSEIGWLVVVPPTNVRHDESLEIVANIDSARCVLQGILMVYLNQANPLIEKCDPGFAADNGHDTFPHPVRSSIGPSLTLDIRRFMELESNTRTSS